MTKINANSFREIINGSATPDNKGISRIVNGSQTQTEDGFEFQGGIKHLTVETLYRNQLKDYLEAIKKGEIEEAAAILKTVPKCLQTTFFEYAGLTDTFIKSEKADKNLSKISTLREKTSRFIQDRKQKNTVSPKELEKLIKSAEGNLENVIIYSSSSDSDFSEDEPVIIIKDEKPSGTSKKLDRMAQDPLMAYVIEQYRKEGASDVRILNRLEGKNERYYRFVSREEFEKLMSGEKVTSTRPYHKGVFTDVTSNPEYPGIPTMGKYRITFKDKDEFDPTKKGESRIIDKDFGKAEFLLRDGYSLEDIEKIELKTDEGEYKPVWQNKNQ